MQDGVAGGLFPRRFFDIRVAGSSLGAIDGDNDGGGVRDGSVVADDEGLGLLYSGSKENCLL